MNHRFEPDDSWTKSRTILNPDRLKVDQLMIREQFQVQVLGHVYIY